MSSHEKKYCAMATGTQAKERCEKRGNRENKARHTHMHMQHGNESQANLQPTLPKPPRAAELCRPPWMHEKKNTEDKGGLKHTAAPGNPECQQCYTVRWRTLTAPTSMRRTVL
jgi:hypothetical protein